MSKSISFLVAASLLLCLFGCDAPFHHKVKQVDAIDVFAKLRKGKKGKRTLGHVKVATVKDTKAIQGLLLGVSKRVSPLYKCGYSGKMNLRSKGKVVLEIEYNLGQKCAHAIYLHKGKLRSYLLSQEGIALLKGYHQKGLQSLKK